MSSKKIVDITLIILSFILILSIVLNSIQKQKLIELTKESNLTVQKLIKITNKNNLLIEKYNLIHN